MLFFKMSIATEVIRIGFTNVVDVSFIPHLVLALEKTLFFVLTYNTACIHLEKGKMVYFGAMDAAHSSTCVFSGSNTLSRPLY